MVAQNSKNKQAQSLRSSVNKNRKSIQSISQKQQQLTCAICLEIISIEKETRLDCCNHRYCGLCIMQWVETQSNSCPLCKKKVTKIISKDLLGRDVEIPIEDKSPSIDSDSFICVVCHQQITEAQIGTEEGTICIECF